MSNLSDQEFNTITSSVSRMSEDQRMELIGALSRHTIILNWYSKEHCEDILNMELSDEKYEFIRYKVSKLAGEWEFSETLRACIEEWLEDYCSDVEEEEEEEEENDCLV